MNYGIIEENEIRKTERLILLALKPQCLSLSVEAYEKMQITLGLAVNHTILEEEMKYAMKVRLRKVLEDVEDYLWLTNWAIINKTENKIIGFIMLKGCPNEFGEVIVGYSIDEEYRRKGYATEALKGLIDWIFKNPKALCVIGDTEKMNIPSHKVLKNAGAIKYKESDELIWWKIHRKETIL